MKARAAVKNDERELRGKLNARLEFQAVIMAGGHGNRMYPLTNGFPKCLLPIANRPILSYTLEILEKAGFNQVIVITEASLEAPVRAFVEVEFKGKIQVELVVLDRPMGTADALRQPTVCERITTDFFVMSGDLITNTFLHDLADVHRARDPALTVLLHHKRKSLEDTKDKKNADESTDAYYIGLNESNQRLLMFRSASDVDETFNVRKSLMHKHPNLVIHNGLMDAHLYLFSHWVLKLIADKPRLSSLQAELLPYLIRNQFSTKLAAYQKVSLGAKQPDSHSSQLGESMNHAKQQQEKETYRCFSVLASDSSFCARVNTVGSYVEVNREIASGTQYEYMPWKLVEEDNLVSQAAKANPSAQIGNCVIGRNLLCGASSIVKKSTLGHNVRMGTGCKIANSYIHAEVTIGDDVSLTDCIVCKGASVGSRSSYKNCRFGPGYIAAEGQDVKNESFSIESTE